MNVENNRKDDSNGRINYSWDIRKWHFLYTENLFMRIPMLFFFAIWMHTNTSVFNVEEIQLSYEVLFLWNSKIKFCHYFSYFSCYHIMTAFRIYLVNIFSRKIGLSFSCLCYYCNNLQLFFCFPGSDSAEIILLKLDVSLEEIFCI